jgi:hypothetical protein
MSVGREYGGEKNLPRGRFIFPIEGPCSETAEYDSTTAYFCNSNGSFCRRTASGNSVLVIVLRRQFPHRRDITATSSSLAENIAPGDKSGVIKFGG